MHKFIYVRFFVSGCNGFLPDPAPDSECGLRAGGEVQYPCLPDLWLRGLSVSLCSGLHTAADSSSNGKCSSIWTSGFSIHASLTYGSVACLCLFILASILLLIAVPTVSENFLKSSEWACGGFHASLIYGSVACLSLFILASILLLYEWSSRSTLKGAGGGFSIHDSLTYGSTACLFHITERETLTECRCRIARLTPGHKRSYKSMTGLKRSYKFIQLFQAQCS